jgi:hypothetical protein
MLKYYKSLSEIVITQIGEVKTYMEVGRGASCSSSYFAYINMGIN